MTAAPNERIGDVTVTQLERLATREAYRAGCVHLLEDVRQEALLAAWQAIETYRPEQTANLSTYQQMKAVFGAKSAIRRLTAHGPRNLYRQDEHRHSDIADPAIAITMITEDLGYAQIDNAADIVWLREQTQQLAMSQRSKDIVTAVLFDAGQKSKVAEHYNVSASRVSQLIGDANVELTRRYRRQKG
jgi:DNA-directed RNA polymerase specialized sigma subunit